jgi:hypothetical protein
MIKERLRTNAPFQPNNFHLHWHYKRPPPGAEFMPPLQPILHPHTQDRRRTAAAKRKAHDRQHTRLRTTQTGRILSQFEQQETVLRHCSNCYTYNHNKQTCKGCKSTDHTRNRCPFCTEETPFYPGSQNPNVLQPFHHQNNTLAVTYTASLQPTRIPRTVHQPAPQSHFVQQTADVQRDIQESNISTGGPGFVTQNNYPILSQTLLPLPASNSVSQTFNQAEMDEICDAMLNDAGEGWDAFADGP